MPGHGRAECRRIAMTKDCEHPRGTCVLAAIAVVRRLARIYCAGCEWGHRMSCYNIHEGGGECQATQLREVLKALGEDYCASLADD